LCKRPYVLPSLVTERGRDERAWPGTVGGTRSTVAEAGQSPSAAGGKLFVCEPHDATGLPASLSTFLVSATLQI